MSQPWTVLTHPRQLLLLLTAGTAGLILASVMVAKKSKKKSPKPEVSSAVKDANPKATEQKTIEVCETKFEKSGESVEIPVEICETKNEKTIEPVVKEPILIGEAKCESSVETVEKHEKSWTELIDDEKVKAS